MTFSLAPDGICTRADLLAAGLRPKRITQAVRSGELVRLRRDRYIAAHDSGHRIGEAVRVGGRLACVSLLEMLGVFVLEPECLHIHIARGMSRLRSPHSPGHCFSGTDRSSTRLHWSPLREPATLGVVGVADALAQAVRCQPVRAAVATVDSVLQLRLLTMTEVRDVFTELPRRYRVVLALADASAESGPETLMRLILRQLGLRYQTQVSVPGVGRVDFLVAGWLIIECDSKAHHEGWAKQREDRRRDLAAAALGLSTLRPLAEDLLYHHESVVAAVRGIVAARRRR